MAKGKDTSLKDANGTNIHLDDNVVYRYSQVANGKNKAISIELFGVVKEYNDDDIGVQHVLFEQEDGKSWVIHDEDQKRITVINDTNSQPSK